MARDDRIYTAMEQATADTYLLPLAVDAELRSGYRGGNREAANLTLYTTFLREFDIRIVNPDQTTAIAYAELAAWCKSHGIATSNNDLWIAATAVQHGAQLLTLDKDFAHIPQVRLAPIPSACD